MRSRYEGYTSKYFIIIVDAIVYNVVLEVEILRDKSE